MKSEYLDRPIAFQRIFVTLTGSITAALMLSQAVYWSKRTKDGWFWKTQEEWEEETGMTRYEQETARKKLRKTDFWQEEKRGVPAKLWYRVDFRKLDCALSADKDAEIPHTVVLESSSPVCGNPASYYTESTTENTTETTTLPSSPDGDGQQQEENPQPEEQQDAVTPTSIRSFKEEAVEIESAASAPSLWQQQVGALCWVCYEHDKVDLLTAEKKGQLTREASVIFQKHDFTLDDLRLWYRHIWKKRWPGTERRPYPSEVRSGIAAIRQREPSGNVWEEMKIAEDGGTPVSESSWEIDPVMMGAYEILKAKGYS